MAMTKIKVLLMVAFVAVFAAGGAVGLSVSRAHHRPHGPSWLAAELGLSDAQREQMHQIWSETMSNVFRNRWEQRRAIAEERDQAILDLLTDEQRTRYDAILEEYARKRKEMEAQREEAFKQAVERTKQILTPEQAAKYEELLKKRPERGPGDRRGRGDRRGPPPGPWSGKPPHPGPPPEDGDEREPPSPPRGEE
jgi:Spy/CpxP family protein refolding chaperone